MRRYTLHTETNDIQVNAKTDRKAVKQCESIMAITCPSRTAIAVLFDGRRPVAQFVHPDSGLDPEKSLLPDMLGTVH